MRHIVSKAVKTSFLALFGLIAVSSTGCVSSKRHSFVLQELDFTKKALYECAKSAETLEKGYKQMSDRAENCQEALNTLDASDDSCTDLRQRVEAFKKHPHTCKHKHLLEPAVGLGQP